MSTLFLDVCGSIIFFCFLLTNSMVVNSPSIVESSQLESLFLCSSGEPNCYEKDFSTNHAHILGTSVNYIFAYNPDYNVQPFFVSGTASSSHSITIHFDFDKDPSISRLAIEPDSFSTHFYPDVYSYQINASRSLTDYVIKIFAVPNDTGLYYDRINPLNVVYYNSSTSSGVSLTAINLIFSNPPDYLNQNYQLKYNDVPFGTTHLQITCTADDLVTNRVYTIQIVKVRHQLSHLVSLLATVGKLSPSFGSSANNTYNLIMHTDDLSTPLKFLLQPADEFANITATLYDNSVSYASNPYSLFGTNLTVNHFFECGYKYSITSPNGYGKYLLLIVVTADDTNFVTTYRFQLDRQSFRLSNLTSTYGSFNVAFNPKVTSYVLTLSNGLQTTNVTFLYGDAQSSLACFFKAAGNAKSVPIRISDQQSVNRMAESIIQLISLPLGTSTLSITTTARDNSSTTYFIIIKRIVFASYLIQNLTITSNGINIPTSPFFDSSYSSFTAQLPYGMTDATIVYQRPTDTVLRLQTIYSPASSPSSVTIMSLPIKKNSNFSSLSISNITHSNQMLYINLLDKLNNIVQQYSIQLSQALSSNNYIQTFYTSRGSMSPIFSPYTFSYNYELPALSDLNQNSTAIPLLPVFIALVTQDYVTNVTAYWYNSVNGTVTPLLSEASTDMNSSSVNNNNNNNNNKLFFIMIDASLLNAGQYLIEIKITAADTTSIRSYYLTTHIAEYVPPVVDTTHQRSTISFNLLFSIDISTIIDVNSFRRQLIIEISQAVLGPSSQFIISSVTPGSITCNIYVLPPSKSNQLTSIVVFYLIFEQLKHFNNSLLSYGKTMQHVVLSALPSPIQGCYINSMFYPTNLDCNQYLNTTNNNTNQSINSNTNSLIIGITVALICLVILMLVVYLYLKHKISKSAKVADIPITDGKTSNNKPFEDNLGDLQLISPTPLSIIPVTVPVTDNTENEKGATGSDISLPADPMESDPSIQPNILSNLPLIILPDKQQKTISKPLKLPPIISPKNIPKIKSPVREAVSLPKLIASPKSKIVPLPLIIHLHSESSMNKNNGPLTVPFSDSESEGPSQTISVHSK